MVLTHKKVSKLKEVISKLLDPNKEKNAKMREKYATDKIFRNKCASRRAAYKIKKLTGNNICFMCGRSDKKIEAHHPDYSKPKQIILLCSRCHSRHHSILTLTKFQGGKNGKSK